MSLPLKEGKYWIAASLLSLPAFLLPIYNPDLFWHLSAGRWILEHGRVPTEDWLSFTKAGAPWLDFEWLSQLVFELAFRLGGFFALWLLKGVLLAATWLVLNAALKVDGVGVPARAAGLVLWSTSALMHADIRPELFSLLLFAAVLCLLESLRLGRLKPGLGVVAGVAALFALWSGLHTGFVLGLAALALYALVEPACLALLGAAALGSLCNPYGAGPYRVAWEHWRQGAQLSGTISEWGPMSARNPVYWGFWLLLCLFAVAAANAARRGRKGGAWIPVALAAALGAAALRHERAAAFFGIASILVVIPAADKEGRWGRRVLAAAAVLCAAFVLWLSPRIYRRGFLNDKFVPRAAAEFLARERAVFEGLRVYNPWEWGGYLGWRLSPWHKVFVDGRYIFHDELPREAAAVAKFDAWRDFVDAERLDALLLQNLPKYFPTTKAYRDGTSRSFDRPYYLFYAPLERWALVYWDPAALVFVRRGGVPAAWLKAHEYRWVRPNDGAALTDALARKELPKAAVDAEALRHQREMLELTRGL